MLSIGTGGQTRLVYSMLDILHTIILIVFDPPLLFFCTVESLC